MTGWELMDRYLIAIGADIDQQSFNAATSALKQLKSHLKSLKYAAAPMAIAGAITAIGKAAVDTIKGVSQADMEYQKLAKSMWTTKETAKALSVAMKTMGVSQDDIAWVPELREQFFRLRAEMQQFATPADADTQLRYIRNIGYDVQALFVRLKMLKEWIAYYLIQYLQPHIESFREFIRYLLDKLGTDMPGIARKVARAMASVLNVGMAALKAFGLVLGKIYDFIVNLPGNVKKWGAVFAAVGAVILAGPFGRLIAGLSMAMLLLEDFMGYMNGWDSSATLAPLWEAILGFANGGGKDFLNAFVKNFEQIFGWLEKILNTFKELIRSMNGGKPIARSFGQIMIDFIVESVRGMNDLVKILAVVMQAIMQVRNGELKEAVKTLMNGVVDFAEGRRSAVKRFFGDGDGQGSSVVAAASRFAQGTQWMDPSGENTDPKNQCASFASSMMRQGGVDVELTMNGDALASQFKELGAYHTAGDGYQPQPGDLIDWAGHVGIYAGGGEYIARNSRGGVTRGSMVGAEEDFGQLWGFGSVAELQTAKSKKTAVNNANDILVNNGFNPLPAAHHADSYAASLFSGGQTPIPGIPGYAQPGSTTNSTSINIGPPNITVTVPGTNATPQQISGAVHDGVKTGFGAYMDTIRARNMRGAIT